MFNEEEITYMKSIGLNFDFSNLSDDEYVKIEDTVKGFKEIIEGKHDDLPEQAFYMVGTIEDAIEKAKTLAE